MAAGLLEQRGLPVLRLHQGVLPDSRRRCWRIVLLLIVALSGPGQRERGRRAAAADDAACWRWPAALCFMGKPLALVGTPYIILAAFVVRSLPASVRAGVASLQQIDPSHRGGLRASWAAMPSTPSAR